MRKDWTTMATDSATRSTATTARVCCPVHNEGVALLTSFTRNNPGRRFFCSPLRKVTIYYFLVDSDFVRNMLMSL